MKAYTIYKNLNKGTYGFILSVMFDTFKSMCLDHVEWVMEKDTSRQAKIWVTKCNNGYFANL